MLAFLEVNVAVDDNINENEEKKQEYEKFLQQMKAAEAAEIERQRQVEYYKDLGIPVPEEFLLPENPDMPGGITFSREDMIKSTHWVPAFVNVTEIKMIIPDTFLYGEEYTRIIFKTPVDIMATAGEGEEYVNYVIVKEKYRDVVRRMQKTFA